MSDIIWVGLNLDAGDNPGVPGSQINAMNDRLAEVIVPSPVWRSRKAARFRSGACYNAFSKGSDLGTILDLYDPHGSRIGFGIRVDDVNRGTEMIPKLKKWMEKIGIPLPVSVWVWSPASTRPSYKVSRVS